MRTSSRLTRRGSCRSSPRTGEYPTFATPVKPASTPTAEWAIRSRARSTACSMRVKGSNAGDIAKMLGVSRATVDRYLPGSSLSTSLLAALYPQKQRLLDDFVRLDPVNGCGPQNGVDCDQRRASGKWVT